MHHSERLDLTHFIFEQGGMLDEGKAGLLDSGNAWRKSPHFRRETVVYRQSPYRPETDSTVVRYGDPEGVTDIYVYSDIWRDLAYAAMFQRARAKAEKSASNKRPPQLGVDSRYADNTRGCTLSDRMPEVLFDLLCLPLRQADETIQTEWAMDARHMAALKLPYKHSGNHFYTRTSGGTPSRNNSCAMHSVSELLATMALTSLAKLEERLRGTHDDVGKLKEQLTQTQDTLAILKQTEKALSDGALLAQIRELQTKAPSIDALESYRERLRKATEEAAKTALLKKINKLEARLKDADGNIPDSATVKAELSRLEAELETTSAAAQRARESIPHLEKQLANTQAVHDTLSAIQEARKAGYTDLLSLHVDKLVESFAGNGVDLRAADHPTSLDSARATACTRLVTFDRMCQRLKAGPAAARRAAARRAAARRAAAEARAAAEREAAERAEAERAAVERAAAEQAEALAAARRVATRAQPQTATQQNPTATEEGRDAIKQTDIVPATPVKTTPKVGAKEGIAWGAMTLFSGGGIACLILTQTLATVPPFIAWIGIAAAALAVITTIGASVAAAKRHRKGLLAKSKPVKGKDSDSTAAP